MVPCGQFNLGFIIAKLGNDLFIVDQHAAGKCLWGQVSSTTLLGSALHTANGVMPGMVHVWGWSQHHT